MSRRALSAGELEGRTLVFAARAAKDPHRMRQLTKRSVHRAMGTAPAHPANFRTRRTCADESKR